MLLATSTLLLALAPAPQAAGGATAAATSLVEARAAFETRLVREDRIETPLDTPPEDAFRLVAYESPLGPMQAYLTPFDPSTPQPAIVWLTGGFPTARGGAGNWRRGAPASEQSATAYRAAGIPMLFPTVRGTAANPGSQELMLGEVDDVLAAARYLAGLEGIDPERIYLGGHSTGGTLALLVAESTDMFRAVFSFGPVAEFSDYGTEDDWPFDKSNPEEWRLRSPLGFLDEIRSPTYVIEGQYGNRLDLARLNEAATNPLVHCIEVPRGDHYDALDPINRLLAAEVLAQEEGPFAVDADAILETYRAFWNRQREAADLRRLADLLDSGLELGTVCRLTAEANTWQRERAEATAADLAAVGIEVGEVEVYEDEDGDPRFRIRATREVELGPAAVFEFSAAFVEATGAHRMRAGDWSLLRGV